MIINVKGYVILTNLVYCDYILEVVL